MTGGAHRVQEPLVAVVVGAGWAGEGHTLAMRHCGVQVAALCARNAEVVRAVADRLAVPEASTDWRATLRAVRPDIVCLATPAALRGEVVAEAAALGAHVLCDKPLALDAGEAARLFRLVHEAGVRHAYATTFRYDPSVAWLAELVSAGRLGRLQEVASSTRRPVSPGIWPWSWLLDPAQGGGWLHNGLTHVLGVLTRVCGTPPVRAVGDARLVPVQAAVVPGLHDFRRFQSLRLTAAEAHGLQRRDGEIERSYRALLVFGIGDAAVRASVTYQADIAVPWPHNGLRLFGSEATLVAQETGPGTYAVALRRPGEGAAEPLPVPPSLAEQVASDPATFVQSRWNALARDFVADIRGQACAPYPTFLDGWRDQVVIEAVRRGREWTDLPAGP